MGISIYKRTTTASVLAIFCMILNCIYFIYRLADHYTASSATSETDVGFLICSIFIIGLSILSAVFYAFAIKYAVINNKNAKTYAYFAMGIDFVIAIIFTIYILRYIVSLLLVDAIIYVLYMIFLFAISAVILHELNGESDVDKKIKLFNDKIEELKQMKGNGVIDEEQAEQLKNKYFTSLFGDDNKKNQ